jgi:phosphoglycerol transferase MdoB-like AlkP superfamily enzyme
LLVFTFLAEITFWEEFKNRFNFIAVDYLIYTYEVIANIQESYNIFLLISIVLIISFLIIYLFKKKHVYLRTFSNKASIKSRLIIMSITLLVTFFYVRFIPNSAAEWSENRYNSEISKAGIYSFFGAYRNNQMKYDRFYTTLNNEDAFKIVRNKLVGPTDSFTDNALTIKRTINANDSLQAANINVIFILVESLSSSFLKREGNEQNITPFR